MGIVTATVNPNVPAAQQATSNDPAGLTVFPQASSLGGFFGATPVAQPSGNAQAALVRGAPSGVVTGWSSYQTGFVSGGVANISSAESNLTINQGTTTSARLLLTAGDVVYLNKPTSQAGLGVGNVRVQASNVVGVTLNNPTAATVTPTTNQVYRIASTRGVPTISLTLSPAAVAPNAIVEQQFALTAASIATNPGASVGQLLQVMKPTGQTGLDIVGCRVVSNNVVGVTFANVTAATITPTASESYTFQALSPLDAHNNFMVATLNMGAIGATSGTGYAVTGGNTTFTGLLATDIPIGPPQAPTAANAGLAATNAAAPILSIITTDTMTVWFQSVGTGSTPTANTYWDQLLFRLNPAAPLVLYSQTLTPTSVAANTTAEQTFTVTGLLANTVVWVNKPSWTSGLGIAGVRVSGANTLAINYINVTGTAIVPPSETYVIGNFQAQAPTATTSNTSGGAMSQQCVQGLMSGINQVAKVRTDLVATGLWAGA